MVGIDIESNGYYHYYDRTCILTVSTPERDAVVDSLALWDEMHAFGEIFSDPNRLILLHSGTYDVASLKRDFNFEFKQIFDTLLAAQLLGREQLGLAGLVRDYLGIELPKELQRYNWTERPLEPAHLSYVVGDTRYLFILREHLLKEIEDKDLHQELELDCSQLALLPAAHTPEPDPEAFRRIKGMRDLNANHRGALKHLCLFRDQMAAEMDLAPFRVMSNGTLMEMVRRNPQSEDDLSRIRGLNYKVRADHGSDLLKALHDGLKDPQPSRRPRDPDANPSAPRPTVEEREFEKELKAWRREEAMRRGIGVQAVLPTPVLQEFLRSPSPDMQALSAHPRMGKRRVERYGEYLADFARRMAQ